MNRFTCHCRTAVAVPLLTLTTALVLLVPRHVAAQQPARLTVIGGASIDVGAIRLAQETRFVRFVNTGGDTLRITSVSGTGAVLTMTTLYQAELGPGDTGTICLHLHNAARPGSQHCQLLIESNDPEAPRTAVAIEARTLRDLYLLPTASFFAVGARAGIEARGSVEIVASGDTAVVVDPPAATSDSSAAVRFDPPTRFVVPAGSRRTLTALVTPRSAPADGRPLQILFRLRTSSALDPEITVPFFVYFAK